MMIFFIPKTVQTSAPRRHWIWGGGGGGGFELGVSGIKELSLDAFEIEYDLKYRSVIL